MPDVEVFFCSEFNSTFFTRCCGVAICDDQEKCPRCKKKVVAQSKRWECAYGKTSRKIEASFREKRKREGLEQADIVAAKLQGKPYSPPRLCLMCGKPILECYC